MKQRERNVALRQAGDCGEEGKSFQKTTAGEGGGLVLVRLCIKRRPIIFWRGGGEEMNNPEI